MVGRGDSEWGGRLCGRRWPLCRSRCAAARGCHEAAGCYAASRCYFGAHGDSVGPHRGRPAGPEGALMTWTGCGSRSALVRQTGCPAACTSRVHPASPPACVRLAALRAAWVARARARRWRWRCWSLWVGARTEAAAPRVAPASPCSTRCRPRRWTEAGRGSSCWPRAPSRRRSRCGAHAATLPYAAVQRPWEANVHAAAHARAAPPRTARRLHRSSHGRGGADSGCLYGEPASRAVRQGARHAVLQRRHLCWAARRLTRSAVQAGVCPASFLSDLTALLFDAEPSRAAQCAACQGAARNAVAALSDATTQDTVRPRR